MQELGSFLALETREELVVDRSAQGELLRINFNISYPSLSCEFATLDVSDALGTVRKISLTSATPCACLAKRVGSPASILQQCPTSSCCLVIARSHMRSHIHRHCVSYMQCVLQKRMNLTKTIRKLPIDEDGQRAGYYVHDDLSNAAIQYDEAKVSLPSFAQRGI